ncbi:phosphotransferase family protein [Bacillus sp. FSL K6-3431]|uniref:phosphotransferase family protein n=1 Tax=Bacillus sp. FSL K6-3431 TaxID=2921500 RepID=UPI0030FCEB73
MAQFRTKKQYILLDSELIFRFPKYEDGIKQLEHEVIFLRKVVDHVSIEVPKPIYLNINPDRTERAFIGYKKIAGAPFEREIMETVKDECHLHHLAGQLGSFLEELHSISTNELVVNDQGYLHWLDMYERIKMKLYPFMNPEARLWIHKHFSNYFGEKRNFEFIPTLIHGDFGTSNILYDSIEKKISGIIDFGSAGIGDPAVDYAALYASYGERFFRYLVDQYLDIKASMEQINFYIVHSPCKKHYLDWKTMIRFSGWY